MAKAALLILVFGALGQSPRYPSSVPVAYFNFEPRADGDFVRPDNWYRVIEPGYPFYVKVVFNNAVVAVPGGRSLEFQMNGGNCAYFSPPIPASSDYNYVVQAQVKTQGLSQDTAFVLVEFLDEGKKLLGRQHLSERLGKTTEWTRLQLGPLAPPLSADVKFMRVACFTQAGALPDLSGSAYFGDLWVGRLPRLHVKTSGDLQIFDADQPKTIGVKVTGIEQRSLSGQFVLYDAEGEVLAQDAIDPLVSIGGGSANEWRLPIANVGYYRLAVDIKDNQQTILHQEFSLTVARPLRGRPAGEFGLSVPPPRGNLDSVERLLRYSGARRLHMPLWQNASADFELRDIGRVFLTFSDRMVRGGYELIGGLDRPPPSVMQNILSFRRGLAEVFLLPVDQWSAGIESVVHQFGVAVTMWQLGEDDDLSFDDVADLDALLVKIKKEMTVNGQEIRLGVPWSWFRPPPDAEQLAFITLSQESPDSAGGVLTASEIARYLKSLQEMVDNTGKKLEIWLQVAPLSSARYDRLPRITDYALRILAAKVGGADAIFAVRIGHPEVGIVDEHGVPTEMFTIWRSMAELLGGAKYLGNVYLPGHVRNEMFIQDGKGLIVLWSDAPQTVELVAGRTLEMADLWGRRKELVSDGITHSIPVGPIPIFIMLADENLLRFQIGMHFGHGQISGQIGRHVDALRVANPFATPIFGEVKPYFPQDWKPSPSKLPLQVRPGDVALADVKFDLPQGVIHSTQEIPIDFEFTSDKQYRFRLYRPYTLGGDTLRIEPVTRLLPGGDLEIEVTITNLTDKGIELDGRLRAYQRAALRGFLPTLAPDQTRLMTFTVPNGRSLIRQRVLLELNEVGASRQFNVQFEVAP